MKKELDNMNKNIKKSVKKDSELEAIIISWHGRKKFLMEKMSNNLFKRKATMWKEKQGN